jgi:tape measure domain-containing protein
MAQEKIDILIQATNDASKELNKVTDDILGVGTATKETEKSVGSFQNAMASLGSQLTTIGAVMSAAVTVPLTLMGKSMLQEVSNIETLRVAFDTLTGSAEVGAKTLKQLNEFAAKTPFSFPEVADSAKQLLAFGFSADRLVSSLQEMGDVAAGVGMPLSNMVYIMGQIKSQGQAYSMQLRRLSMQGVPVYTELAKILGVNVAEVRQLVSDGKIGFPQVEQVLRNLTSETFTGTMALIKDKFTEISMEFLGLSINAEDFGTIIKGGPFDMLKDAAIGTLDAINNLIDAFQKIDQPTKNLILGIVGMVAAIGPLALLIAGVGMAFTLLLSPLGLVIAALTVFGAVLLETAIQQQAVRDSVASAIELNNRMAASYRDLAAASQMFAEGSASKMADLYGLETDLAILELQRFRIN